MTTISGMTLLVLTAKGNFSHQNFEIMHLEQECSLFFLLGDPYSKVSIKWPGLNSSKKSIKQPGLHIPEKNDRTGLFMYLLTYCLY